MSRYGIAEWYGRPFLALSPGERRKFAATALGETAPPRCPFREMACSKKGGVCTIQRYARNGAHIGAPEGDPVVVCPARLEQDRIILKWLADIVGFRSDAAMVAREIPFMTSTVTGKAAGRIDIVLAEVNGGLAWFGLEIQAVYFSGPGMDEEFRTLLDSADSRPPYPSSVRRPDWRSSSAKRLMPQLQVKGPTLRRWGSKIAVAVDRPFFEAMGGPSPDASHDLNDGDVLWLVTKVSDFHLRPDHWEALTLEAATDKLLAARTVRKQHFEEALREKLEPMREAS